MLEKFLGRRRQPLTGAPEIRRQKTYSAQSGYVYHYYYAGHRPFREGTEYVFEVSADRKQFFAVSVFLPAASLGPWQQTHGRELITSERYAIVKLSLFHAFDERPQPSLMREHVNVRAADVEGVLATLGLE